MNLKLDLNADLFNQLSQNPPPWWQNLKKANLAIQIRKNNVIDVYYNGGAIIRELKYVKGHYSAVMHREYIPLLGEKNYISYVFDGKFDFNQNEIKPLSLSDFNGDDLKLIKKQIEKFYPKDSEKGIQHSFIIEDLYFIDAEFQVTDENEKMRADLVRIDVNLKKIVFVEVKTMGNPEIYTNEIVEQLKKYVYFINTYKPDLLDYYKKLFEIKKKLGILPKGLQSLKNLDGFDILENPLLIFGGCEQEWINSNATVLDNKIKGVAKGCYYFGKANNCDIIKKSNKNRHIF